MSDFWEKHSLFKRLSASLLIFAHLVTFSNVQDALNIDSPEK